MSKRRALSARRRPRGQEPPPTFAELAHGLGALLAIALAVALAAKAAIHFAGP